MTSKIVSSLRSKTALVMGVSNGRSIAWSSALSLLDRGFKVIVTYQNDRLENSVQNLVDQFHRESSNNDRGNNNAERRLFCLPCDVSEEESVSEFFSSSLPPLLKDEDDDEEEKEKPLLDTIVHSVAYAPATALKGSLLETTKEDFSMAHEISAYSLISVTRNALPLLSTGGYHQIHDAPHPNELTPEERANLIDCRSPSITTLSFGASQAVPNYNVMGSAKASLESIVRGLALEVGFMNIRVNAVSAGPIRTLASKGLHQFNLMRKESEKKAPLQRNVEADEVGRTVAWLSDMEAAGGITGQTIYVDGGYSVVSGPSIGDFFEEWKANK